MSLNEQKIQLAIKYAKEVNREDGKLNLAKDFDAGFSAALSINLPVKFYDWYQSINKMGHETRVKIVKELNLSHYPTTQDFYNYWIENVYKFE